MVLSLGVDIEKFIDYCIEVYVIFFRSICVKVIVYDDCGNEYLYIIRN